MRFVGDDLISKGILYQIVGEAELKVLSPKGNSNKRLTVLQKITGSCDMGWEVIVNCGLEVCRLLSAELIGDSSHFKTDMQTTVTYFCVVDSVMMSTR